jgi:hypothetical protein
MGCGQSTRRGDEQTPPPYREQPERSQDHDENIRSNSEKYQRTYNTESTISKKHESLVLDVATKVGTEHQRVLERYQYRIVVYDKGATPEEQENQLLTLRSLQKSLTAAGCKEATVKFPNRPLDVEQLTSDEAAVYRMYTSKNLSEVIRTWFSHVTHKEEEFPSNNEAIRILREIFTGENCNEYRNVVITKEVIRTLEDMQKHKSPSKAQLLEQLRATLAPQVYQMSDDMLLSEAIQDWGKHITASRENLVTLSPVHGWAESIRDVEHALQNREDPTYTVHLNFVPPEKRIPLTERMILKKALQKAVKNIEKTKSLGKASRENCVGISYLELGTVRSKFFGDLDKLKTGQRDVVDHVTLHGDLDDKQLSKILLGSIDHTFDDQ